MRTFLACHVIVSFIYIIAFANIYHTSLNAIVLHLMLVASAYTSVLFVTPKRIWPIITSITTVFFVLIYLANIIAIKFWNELVSLDFLVRNYEVLIFEFKRMLAFLITITAVFIFATFIFYRKFTPSIINGRLRSFGWFLFIPTLFLMFSLLSVEITDDLNTIWEGEPVYEFFKTNNSLKNIENTIRHSENPEVKSELPNIVFIHADGLRADRLRVYGNERATSPFIDSLIDEGAVVFEQSFSNCSESICGVSSVLTSTFSYETAPNDLITNLTELGYITNFVGTGDLFHANLNRFFEPRLFNFLRADSHQDYYKHDDTFILDTLDLFPNHNDRSTFFYLRMMSTHGLGSHKQRFKRFSPVPESLLSAIGGKKTYSTLVNDRDNRVIQFDHYLKQIFQTLEEKKYLQNAIVVIFGDHGDAFGERGHFGHYHSLFNEEIKIPIIVWKSHSVEMTLNTNTFATLMDIPPTVLSYLNQDIPTSYMGKPLQTGNQEKVGFLDNKRGTKGYLYQNEDKLYKVMQDKNGSLRVFDLMNDPQEKTNLASTSKELLNKIKKHISCDSSCELEN